MTLGLLQGFPVCIVHTETANRIHIISFRKATKSMSKNCSSAASRTDWKRLRAMRDSSIRITDEHPEASVRHIVRGIVRRGLKQLPAKTSVSLRVDADVLEWFKRQGPGYQTRMNAVLRAFRDISV